MIKNQEITFGLIGAGGFAREVMPLVLETLPELKKEQIFFVETKPKYSSINGYPIISEKQFLSKNGKLLFNIAIGDSLIRKEISERLKKGGATPVSLISKTATIYDNNEIGEGAIICAYSTITSNAKIGKFFNSNIYSYVAHDCEIGNFVTFAPRVHCNGNVRIQNHAYIGTGAIIKQGTSEKPLIVGEKSIVGMGSVVTKNVPTSTTVFGIPAKDIKSRGKSK